MSKKSNLIIWILATVSLIILILGSVLFGIYRTSPTHDKLSKTGLGLLISGAVLLVLTVIVAVVRHRSSSDSDSSDS
jgi:uncharacterized BrkB/YihY/UPF0761 family membrane protein